MIFDTVIGRVLGSEGGYVNNPADPGGETNWGIAKRSYPNVDIKNLTREGAIAIYRRDFWDTVGGDQLPTYFVYQAVDAAVNHGISRSIKLMEQSVGQPPTGKWSSLCLAGVLMADPGDLCLLFLAARLEYYTSLSTFATFGKGWSNRVAKSLRFAAEDN